MKKVYINEIPKLVDKEIELYGWVHEIRDTAKFLFIIIRDVTGKAQITINKDLEEIAKIGEKLHHEDVIYVKGIVKKSEIAKLGYEIIPNEIKVISKAKHPLALDVTRKVDAELNTILDARYLSLRREDYNSIFKIQSAMVRYIREFLYERGFIEIFTPKIIKFATEGGAELFEVKYFDEIAYLAQSPQIYKEICSGAFEKVFEIASYFRAEKSRTPYHLSEFLSFDVECAFYSYHAVMDLLESLIKYVINKLYENNEKEFKVLKSEKINVDYKFERIKYDEVISILEPYGIKWGDDLTQHTLKLLEEKIGKKFFFIIDWPTELKPFYTYEHEDNPKITKSFDFNYGFLEIASGGERIYKSEQLIQKLKKMNLNPENFSLFIKALDSGMPPHAGFGLGISRLLLILTNSKNVKEVVLFPRDVDRLIP